MKKNKLKILLFMMLYAMSYIGTIQAKDNIIIAKNVNDTPTVVASIVVDNTFTPNSLFLHRKKDSSLESLTQYYQSATKNDAKLIMQLSFVEDGTQAWMTKELLTSPDKFQGFKQLADVQVVKKYLWGQYDIYIVDWYVKPMKKVMSWYEAIHCQDGGLCFWSNLILNGTESSAIFSDTLTLALKNTKTTKSDLKYKLNVLPNEGGAYHPQALEISFDIQWFKQPILIAKINQASAKSNSEPSSVGEFSHFTNFLQSLWQLNYNDIFQLKLDSPIFKESWQDFNPRKLFVVFSKNHEKKHYITTAYFQHLAKMDSFKILGVLHAKNERYLIGQASHPVTGGNSEKIMIFSLDNTSSLLIQADQNSSLYNIIYSKMFNQKITEIVSGRGR